MLKARLLLMGLLAILALEAAAAVSASANPGPFWWHRNNSKEGAGEKLAETKSEQFQGSGLGTRFKSKEGGTEFTLVGETQVKGDIWNEPNQGQIKVQVKFLKVTVSEPTALDKCTATVKVPEDYVGHLMWKYQGNAKELIQAKAETGTPTQEEQNQKWDAILFPAKTQLKTNSGELEQKNQFAEVHLENSSANCGVLSNVTLKPKGASGFSDQSLKLEEFSQNPTLEFPGSKVWQHYWNGTEVKTVEGKLVDGEGTEARFEGALPVHFDEQEVDLHEK